MGARQTPLPQQIAGRDVFRFLEALRVMDASVDSRLGRRLRTRETLIGSSPWRARRLGIRLRPRVTGASGTTLTFADGSREPVGAVVWATGFRPDHGFVRLPVFDDAGRVRHRRGVTTTAGLYFLGLPWQHTRGSALLGWVQDDARFIAGRIAEHAGRHATAGGLAAAGG